MDEWLKFNTGSRAALNGSFNGAGAFEKRGKYKKTSPDL
ncbi:hypothetical protein SAMN05428971_4383 [Candidatus Pantoea varia]|uniref:Uncharacterized protein n=1 Tax=Candidatus Pantoea varia TaxID=1881036 RepID=A0A1I5HZ07_9GAMM|nr:hypothetical protein SAMN05428971_4383 [Pantoea varia]